MASRIASRYLTSILRTPSIIRPSNLRPNARLPRTLQPVLRRSSHTIPKPPSSGDPPPDSAKPSQKRIEPHYKLTFTCVPCAERSTHIVSKQGYHKGSVLITCPQCRNRHVISDHLGIFGDRKLTVEDILREKGQLVKRGTLGEDGDVEFWQDDTAEEHGSSALDASSPSPSQITHAPLGSGVRPSVTNSNPDKSPSSRRQFSASSTLRRLDPLQVLRRNLAQEQELHDTYRLAVRNVRRTMQKDGTKSQGLDLSILEDSAAGVVLLRRNPDSNPESLLRRQMAAASVANSKRTAFSIAPLYSKSSFPPLTLARAGEMAATIETSKASLGDRAIAAAKKDWSGNKTQNSAELVQQSAPPSQGRMGFAALEDAPKNHAIGFRENAPSRDSPADPRWSNQAKRVPLFELPSLLATAKPPMAEVSSLNDAAPRDTFRYVHTPTPLVAREMARQMAALKPMTESSSPLYKSTLGEIDSGLDPPSELPARRKSNRLEYESRDMQQRRGRSISDGEERRQFVAEGASLVRSYYSTGLTRFELQGVRYADCEAEKMGEGQIPQSHEMTSVGDKEFKGKKKASSADEKTTELRQMQDQAVPKAPGVQEASLLTPQLAELSELGLNKGIGALKSVESFQIRPHRGRVKFRRQEKSLKATYERYEHLKTKPIESSFKVPRNLLTGQRPGLGGEARV